MIDINPTHLEIVQHILNEHVPDCEVRAFGSRATWVARDYSDLDLAVVGDRPLKWSILGKLKDAFQESSLPFRVDVLDWHDISDNFRKIIEADCTAIKKAIASKIRPRTTLGEAAEIVMGQSPPGSTVSPNEGIPLLNGPSEFGVHHPTPVQFTTDPRRYAQPGDILFCVRGSTGKMNWADQEYAIGRGLAAIRHRKSPDLQPFLRAVIEQKLPYLLAEATGSIFSNISASQLRTMSFPLFSEREQQNIAHILGTLDDKIKLNRRMNETLEAMAQTLFKSWFVDFDPVRAKMEGRWRPGESLPGLPAHLYDLFPDRLTPSDLGDIPEGWHIKSLDEIAVFKNGLALQKYRPTRRDKRLPVVKISQLRNGIADSREWATASIGSEHIINDGDIIFSWSGSLMVQIWCGGEAALNQHLFKVISNRYPRWLVWHLLNSHLLNFQIIASGKATTLGHIKRHHLQEAVCVVPNNVALTVADELQSIIFNRIVRAKVQVRRLKTLRKNLLINLDQLL